MTDNKPSDTKAFKRPNNTLDLFDGYVNLDDGMSYTADGEMIIPEVEDPEHVVLTENVGIYRRSVYDTGSVAIVQVRPRTGNRDTLLTAETARTQQEVEPEDDNATAGTTVAKDAGAKTTSKS